MAQIIGTIELSLYDINNLVRGAKLLESYMNVDRANKGLSYHHLNENDFLRWAINHALTDLSHCPDSNYN